MAVSLNSKQSTARFTADQLNKQQQAPVQIHLTDMIDEPMQNYLIEMCYWAIDKNGIGENGWQLLSRSLKTELDKACPNKEGWQVLAGRKFSAMVTHDKGPLLYLTVQGVSILIYANLQHK